MKEAFTTFLVSMFVLVCTSRIESQVFQVRADPQDRARQTVPIDLAKIGHIAPKGRVQDKEYNQLEVVERLIAGGKESIPFLISQLESEKRVQGQVIDFWRKVTVGDLASIILLDLFTDPTWSKPTITGLTWNEFLEVEKDSDQDAEQQLRSYLSKHGRRQIKAKWQRVWEQNQERLYWDENDRCFKLRPL
jgi:hypothetical protein